MQRSHRHEVARGFTLIDMAIALTVLSILAAVMIPGNMSQARNRMGESAVRQIFTIFDAARWYHAYSGPPTTEMYLNADFKYHIWPGQAPTDPSEDDPYLCRGNFVAADVQQQLKQWNLLEGGRAFKNPWEEAYAISLDSPDKTTPGYSSESEKNCWFTVTTAVPIDVVPMFTSYLPNAHCADVRADACPTNVTAPEGFVRCCASIPPPGMEVKFREWMGSGVLHPHYCSPFETEAKTVPCPDYTL
ncbi:MAG: hypothetical protein A2289_12975 [Deltaproteobacteria bacterium RIFOXYA12_FULL_58_15]|nr:MAG: hypothetical protein A2289_12975 [Deltaproteobacteria bacterium RIFOXYA12_FULL_58_15]OGR10155.1 MAG: hypothetical protein A2341_06190 [Deltaproteobacteria bacterium RIFOXYB12_FULL_58_9]